MQMCKLLTMQEAIARPSKACCNPTVTSPQYIVVQRQFKHYYMYTFKSYAQSSHNVSQIALPEALLDRAQSLTKLDHLARAETYLLHGTNLPPQGSEVLLRLPPPGPKGLG